MNVNLCCLDDTTYQEILLKTFPDVVIESKYNKRVVGNATTSRDVDVSALFNLIPTLVTSKSTCLGVS